VCRRSGPYLDEKKVWLQLGKEEEEGNVYWEVINPTLGWVRGHA